MIQKSTYEAPSAELYTISTQEGILALSDGKGAQAPNVEGILPIEIITSPEW